MRKSNGECGMRNGGVDYRSYSVLWRGARREAAMEIDSRVTITSNEAQG